MLRVYYCSMYSFNIIATYSDGDQDIFDIELNNIHVRDEKTFLLTLFESEIKLKNLIKYSISQSVDSVDELLPFIRERFGKYHFTEEDEELLNLKKNYLNLHNYKPVIE